MVKITGTYSGTGYEYDLSGNKIKYKVSLTASKIKEDKYKFTIIYKDLTNQKNPEIIENIIVIVDKSKFIAEDATGNGINYFKLSGSKLIFKYNINGDNGPQGYGNVSASFNLNKE